MSTTEAAQEAQTPNEIRALVEALRRKVNHQADRIDELEQEVDELKKGVEK